MHLIWSWIRGGQIRSCFVSWRQFYACSFDSTLITGKFWNIWSETLPHKLLPFAFTGIALPDSHHVVRQQKLPFGHSHTTLFRWFLFCFQKRINEVMAKLRAPLKHLVFQKEKNGSFLLQGLYRRFFLFFFFHLDLHHFILRTKWCWLWTWPVTQLEAAWKNICKYKNIWKMNKVWLLMFKLFNFEEQVKESNCYGFLWSGFLEQILTYTVFP